MNKVSIAIIGAVILLLASLVIFNKKDSTTPQGDNGAWNNNMVVGASDAPNRIVEYGDYFCFYCSQFHEQVASDKFKEKYLDTNKVRVETRPVTLLAGPHSPNSEAGAEAAFCAADQNKYDEYSNHIIPRIKHDYFDKGIGVKAMDGKLLASPKTIEKLPQDYFNKSAKAVGMDVSAFDDCMTKETHKHTISRNTQKSLTQGVRGLPHIIINDYVASGFDGGWDGFELMLKSGKVK